MKKAQISVPLVGIEPATPCVQGGSLERSATRLVQSPLAEQKFVPFSIYHNRPFLRAGFTNDDKKKSEIYEINPPNSGD